MIYRILLLGLVCLAACGKAGPLDTLQPGEQGRVVRILDGDTLALNTGLVVKLASLEAPSFGRGDREDRRVGVQLRPGESAHRNRAAGSVGAARARDDARVGRRQDGGRRPPRTQSVRASALPRRLGNRRLAISRATHGWAICQVEGSMA